MFCLFQKLTYRIHVCPKNPAFYFILLVYEFYSYGQTWHQKYIGTYLPLNSWGEPQDIRHVSRVDKVVDCHHYSNIHRLLRVTAFILRFVANMKHAIGLSEIKFSGPLSAEELLAAKTQ